MALYNYKIYMWLCSWKYFRKKSKWFYRFSERYFNSTRIGSIFLFFYEKKQEKKCKRNLKKSISSKDEKISYISLELIQYDLLEKKYLSISDYFIILLLFFIYSIK